MGLINEVKIIFGSQGADQASRDADRVGRSQTRLGQASAGAGRQFSAQASGLGGLVAAYAGAAATAFALQAVFDGLSRSARAIQTLEGLTALAAQTAQDGKSIAKSVREITNAQMTLVQSAELVNLSLSAGFNSEQIEGLAEVALRASRALGRDLTDAYTRVIRGSAKLETELLDELGIYTKIDPATRAYAAAIGKSVTELTEFERRQAFVNSVIEEGQRKFASISISVPTASEKIEAFGSKILDLATQVGSFLARVLAPIAEFFTENFGASWGALAAAGFLVLRKGVQELTTSLTSAIANIENRVQGVKDRLGSISAQAMTAGQGAAKAINLSSAGLGGGLRSELKDLRDTARARSLSNEELRKANTLLARREVNLRASRVAILQQSAALLQQRSALRASGQSTNVVNAALAAQAKKLINNRKILNSTTISMNALTAATVKANSTFSLFVATAYSGMLRVGASVAALALGMLSLGSILLGAVALIGVFGSAIAKLSGTTEEWSAYLENQKAIIASLFNSVENRRRSTVNLGLATAAMEEAEAADTALAQIEDFTFTTKYLGIDIEITKSKQDIVSEVASIIDGATREYASFADALVSGPGAAGALEGALSGAVLGATSAALLGGPAAIPAALTGAVVGAVIGGLTSAFRALDNEISIPEVVRNRLTEEFSETLSGVSDTAAEEIVNMLGILEQQSSAARSLDPTARAVYRLQQQILIDSAKQLSNVEAISSIIQATGADAAQVAAVYSFEEGVAATQEIRNNLRTATISIGGVDLSIGVLDTAAEEIQSIIEAALTIAPELDVTSFVDSLRSRLESVVDGLDSGDVGLAENILQFIDRRGNRLVSQLEQLSIGAIDISQVTGADALQNAMTMLNEATGSATINFDDLNMSQISVSREFQELNTNIVDARENVYRTQGVLYELQIGLDNNTISLEQFSQATTSAGDSISRGIPKIIEAQNSLQTLRDAIQSVDPRTEEYTNITALIDAQAVIVGQLETQFELQNSILQSQREQEGTLVDRIALTEYLNEINKDASNIYQTMGIVATAGGLSTEDYLISLLDQNRETLDNFREYQEEVQALQLPDAATQALLSTGVENFDQLQATLASLRIEASLVGDEIILTGETLNTINSDRVNINAQIALQSEENLANAARAAQFEQALISLSNTRADEAAVFLATSSDLLSNLEDQLFISTQELEIAQIRSEAAARALEYYDSELIIREEIAALENDTSYIETRLALAETIAEVEQNRINLLITQAEIQQEISNNESKAIIDRLTNAQELLTIYSSIGQSLAAIEMNVSGADSATRAGAQVSNRLQVIQLQFANEIRLLTAREQAEQQRIENERNINTLRLDAAETEYDLLNSTLQDRMAILRNEEALAALSRDNDLLALQERRDVADFESKLLEKTSNLEKDQLLNRIEADKARTLSEAENIKNYLDVVSQSDVVQTAFVNRFGQIVTTLGELLGADVTGLSGFDVENFSDISNQVDSTIGEINGVYSTISDNALTASDLATQSAEDRLQAEITFLDRQIEAQRAYNLESAILAGQRVAAQQQLFDSEIALAEAAIIEVSLAAVALDTELSNLAQNYLDEGMLAQANAAQAVATELARISDVVRQQIESFASQVKQSVDTITQIQNEEILLNMRFNLDRQNLQDQIAAAREQFELEQLQANIQLTTAQESSGTIDAITAAERINEYQQEILTQQEAMLAQEAEQYQRRRSDERNILGVEFAQRREALDAELSMHEARIEAEYAIVEAQIQQAQDFLSGRQSLDNALITGLSSVFNSFGTSIQTVFASVVTAFGSMFADVEGFGGVGSVAGFETFSPTDLAQDIEGLFSGLRSGLDTSRTAAINSTRALSATQEGALNREQQRAEELYDLQTQLDTESFEHRARLAETERLIEDENAAARIASAEEAGGAAEEVTNTLRDQLLAIYDSIQSNLENAFMELNDLIFYGEGDFGEILGNLFRSIQTDIFQTTIAEPLSNYLTDTLFSAFGIEGGRRGIENAMVDPDGALRVRNVDESGLGGLLGSSTNAKEAGNQQGLLGGIFGQTRQEMSGIFGGGGFLSQLLQSLFGQGGLFSSLLRGIGGLLSSIFGGVGGSGGGGGLFSGIVAGIFGTGAAKASGGFVHMAQGGMLGASALRRDRVPTMLEPGEFVIRRSAARNIGAANLQAMNATGQAQGNVQVNINNQGTPQEATASPPKFDGEKYVIDIVTRDLANNGPIRRSIRGGAL